MKPTIEVTLPYADENGQEKEYEFTISFISQSMIRDSNNINAIVNDVSEHWRNFSKLMNKIEDNKGSLAADEITETLKQAKVEKDEITKLNAHDFFKKRAELAIKIIRKNRYIDETQEYLHEEFWDECVEPDVLNSFIQKCVAKDLSGVKKKI